MSDELRSRIMGVLRKHKLSDPGGGTAAGAWCKCSCGAVHATSSRDHAGLLAQRHQAQAIIDEFELTVEERNNGETSESADGIEVNYAIESRIVGKWEKQ